MDACGAARHVPHARRVEAAFGHHQGGRPQNPLTLRLARVAAALLLPHARPSSLCRSLRNPSPGNRSLWNWPLPNPYPGQQ